MRFPRAVFPAILLLALLVSCSKKDIDYTQYDCNRLEGDERDACLYEKAQVLKDHTVCLDMVDVDLREKCILYLALNECDYRMCNDLRLRYRPEGCREEISLRDSCEGVLEAMQAAKEFDPTDVVTTEDTREPGVTDYLDDNCANEDEEDRDHCYELQAMVMMDVTVCDRIRGERFEDLGSNPPRDKCYLKLAIEQCDVDLCRKIIGGQQSFSIDGCQQIVDQQCE